MPRPNLKEYDRKRDFSRTPEPSGDNSEAAAGPLIFVVQRHQASHLHYDVRLELDGVLKSWSVPRGPSLDPSVKRRAMATEDHPMPYASFEGVIPKAEYGGGEVVIWDWGTYSPDEPGYEFGDRDRAQATMRSGMEAGKLSITFRGLKMKGSWTFVRISDADRGWLLIKHKDIVSTPDVDICADQTSVVSGLSVEELAAGVMPRARARSMPISPAVTEDAVAGPISWPLVPMNATQEKQPFSNPNWMFEPKLDGIRAVARIVDGEVELRTRRKNVVTEQYPGVAAALARQPASSLVLDGEIVAFDERGVPSFQLLQQRMNMTNESEIRTMETQLPVVFMAFDLLEQDGYDLTRAAVEDRKELLLRALLPSASVVALEPIEANGIEAYEAATTLGFEGVVAKRKGSRYLPGRRSGSWLKLKARRSDDFIVGGFTAGEGGRGSTFGGLLLGRPGKDGLVFAGRVGSGFDEHTLKRLRARLKPLETDESPFAGKVPGLDQTTFVKPELVVEAEFAEWTSAGHLRAPVFLRVRDDKPASDVSVREPPPPAPSPLLDDRTSLMEQLDSPLKELTLEGRGFRVPITNLDKELWPGIGEGRALTKRDYLRYVVEMSPLLLHHLTDRPLTMTRYPNGIGGTFFYQRHAEQGRPDFVDTIEMYSREEKRDKPFVMCNNLPTLLWLAQLADLELHAGFGRTVSAPDGEGLPTNAGDSEEALNTSILNYPDFILFDLDPYIYEGSEAKGEEPELNRRAFMKTVETARWLKEVLDAASLSSFVKTSGATGLHIYVPIIRQFDYAITRSLCETIFAQVLRAHPRDVTMEWSTEKRTGKVFLDVNMNVRAKNLASVYSPRAKPGAPVSMPLRWDELESVYPTDFTILTAPAAVKERGDLWANLLDAKQDLSALLGL